MKHRGLAAILGIVSVAALSLTGCSSGGSSASSFDFWSFTGIGQKTDVQKYEKEHKGVTIKLTEVGSSVETAQALTTALAGGKVPDLVLIQGDDLPNFVANPQNFVDLRTLGAGKIANEYLPWVWKQSVAKNGSVLGVPTDVGGMAIAYRSDLFQAAGLPTDPAAVAKLWPTWDDFIKVGEEYRQKTGKAFIDNTSTSVFYQTVNQVSEKYYAPDGKLVYDSNPQVKAAFDTAIKATQAKIGANLQSFSPGWAAGTAKGDFAAMAAPAWMLGAIKTNAPATAGKWEITSVPGVAGNWGGSYLAIPKRAKNPEAAWAYIKEMQSPASQLAHFTSSGSLPTTPSVYNDPALTTHKDPFFPNSEPGKIYPASVKAVKPFLNGPATSAIGAAFQSAIAEVEAGGNPETAWATALKNVKSAVG